MSNTPEGVARYADLKEAIGHLEAFAIIDDARLGLAQALNIAHGPIRSILEQVVADLDLDARLPEPEAEPDDGLTHNQRLRSNDQYPTPHDAPANQPV